MPIKCIIITESLVNGSLPESLIKYEERRYPHLMSGVEPVEIILLQVPESEVPRAAFDLSEVLLPRKFYAHFVTIDALCIVYPGCVYVLKRGDADSLRRCKAMGRMFDVPEDQMPFEAMFEVDHPNVQ